MKRFFLCLLFTISSLQAQDAPDATKQFETLAKETIYFDWHLARQLHTDDQQIAALYQTFRTHFLALKIEKQDVLPLLKHTNPRVRALAIVYLSALQDSQVLPAIADLLEDRQRTFLGPGFTTLFGTGPLRSDITVSEIASNALASYLNREEYPNPHPGVNSTESVPVTREEFDLYWSKHTARSYYGSWFYARARQTIHLHMVDQDKQEDSSATEMSPGMKMNYDLIRADIEKQVPQPERAWLCVWLNRNIHSANVLTPYQDEELFKLLKDIGPDAVLDTLKTIHVPGDDPDLNDPENFKLVRSFILMNSDKILRPQDSDKLIALNDPKNPSPWWYIAAAQLKPERAAEILRSGYSHFTEKEKITELNMALWKLGDKSQTSFLVNQFYGGSPRFVEIICDQDKSTGQKLVAAILQDHRALEVRMSSTDFTSLAKASNRWADKVIVTPDEMGAATREEGGKGGPGFSPDTQHLKVDLLHRMRDSIPLWKEPQA